LYTDGILIGVGVGGGVVGTTVSCIVSVTVGVAVGIGVPAGALTHPMKTDDKTIRIIEIIVIFLIPFHRLYQMVLFINNVIDLFSDSDLLERFIINAFHQSFVWAIAKKKR